MLRGQIALVTGASRGIGLAIAQQLGQHGATVVGTATTEIGAETIARNFAGADIGGCGMVLNVNDSARAEWLIAETQSRFGEISVLVNNAGVTRDNLLVRMKEAEWDDIIATDLKSVYTLSKLVLRSMIKARAGRIINIASVVAAMGNPGQTNYAAAKAGMIGFSKSLAREVGSRNITVNCVAPGFIETDMARALAPTQRDALLRNIPLGRLGNADEVAAAVLFLASPHASYITGSTLHVNGGMHMD